MTHAFHPTVLREYDIRGIIGETLGVDDARAIGRGFATLLREAGGKQVAVGYDGRTQLADARTCAGRRPDRERLRRGADRHGRRPRCSITPKPQPKRWTAASR